MYWQLSSHIVLQVIFRHTVPQTL